MTVGDRSRSPTESSCSFRGRCGTRDARCRRSGCCRRSGVTTSTRGPTWSTSTLAASARSSVRTRSPRSVGWDTGSMRPDALEWPNRERWIDVAWVLFSLANLAAMLLLPSWETVPFPFLWGSLTVLYGFRVWRTRPTLTVLAAVMVATGLFIWIDFEKGAQPLDEITEVPLMAAMFVAMV